MLAAGFGTGALCALTSCTDLMAMVYGFSLRLEKP